MRSDCRPLGDARIAFLLKKGRTPTRALRDLMDCIRKRLPGANASRGLSDYKLT